MNLDRQLRRALRREAPAPGFAQRVMQRIERADERAVAWSPRRWRALAASLLLTASISAWVAYDVAERRRIEGERARDQVLLALRIAGEKVRLARQEVRDIGSND